MIDAGQHNCNIDISSSKGEISPRLTTRAPHFTILPICCHHVLWFAFILLVFLAGARAQNVHPPPTTSQISSLLEMASGLPAEYYSDLVFQLIELRPSLLRDKQVIDALLNVFSVSRDTKYLYPVKDVSGAPFGRSRLLQLDLASSKLDGLDIQSRVVAYLLQASPRLAATYLGRMSVPDKRDYTCDDPYVQMASPYYSTALLLLNTKGIARIGSWQTHDSYLEHLIASAPDATHVPPLAQLLSHVTIDPNEHAVLVDRFSALLSDVRASDREMTAIEDDGTLTRSIDQLVNTPGMQSSEQIRVLNAYRSFLTRSLRSEACRDKTVDRHELRNRFNALISSTKLENKVSLLKDTDVSPLGISATLTHQPQIPVTPQFKGQLVRLSTVFEANQSVRARTGGRGSYQEDPSDVEDIQAYILSAFPVGAACPECEYESRQVLFVALLSNLSPGKLLEQVINQDVKYVIAKSPIEDLDPSCWLKIVKNLINSSRLPTPEDQDKLDQKAREGRVPMFTPNGERRELLRVMADTNDPILRVYVAAERVMSPTYQMRYY